MTVMLLSRQNFRQLSNGILVFLLGSKRMSGMRGSKAGATHNLTYEEQYAEVVGLAQTFYALVDVLWVETMISQAARQGHPIILSPQVERKDKTEKPEEKHTGTSADLVVGCYVAKLLWNVANAFDDRIKTLTWVDDDRVA